MPLPYESVPSAVDELKADAEVDSEKARLARDLVQRGFKPLCVGRSLVTIERLEEGEERDVVANWGSLSISVYPDPDVAGHEHATSIIVEGSRSGVPTIHVRLPGRGGTLTYKP